ncbi:hypothetical protein ACFLZC_02360 [Patescibacteria group bacterium]
MNNEKVKKRIGFDLDNTLLDNKKLRVEFFNKSNFYDIPEDMPIENVKKILKRNDYLSMQNYIYGEMTLKAEPTSGTREVLDELEKNFDLYVISRRKTKDYAKQWLELHFNFLPENIFFVEDDHLKAGVAVELGLSSFVDDKIKVLENFPLHF